MVLNKRKPVHLIPQPTNLTDTTEVFVMKGTDEVFTDYEKYIKRFDWLNQKKFTDAVNGKSGLTYWDALQSETKSTKLIENVFPEVLRDPILRKVQFSTISRMDELVNTIFDEFKHDFFPGEDVSVLFDSGEQLPGVIREKAKFPMIRAADGSIQREPFSRYFVRLSDNPTDEALADDKHIRRDRKVFTKQNLRSFLKNSLQREAWTGAPWLVKEHLAIHYRLPMEIPAHLLQDARILMHKQQALAVRPPKGRKSNKNLTAQDFSRMQQDDPRMHMNHSQQHPGAAQHQHLQNNAQVQIRPPAPPPIKYPIEDLDVAPKRNGVTRPELKFFTEEMDKYVRSNRKSSPSLQGIDMEAMGMLLEVWNTLNVQCEVYVLDSFTFDDFVNAMSYSNLDTPCELLDEIHCAVLKLFLDKEGAVTVKDLPKKPEEGGDDSEMQDESEVSTPAEDVPARSTRSRLSIVESAADVLQSPGEKGNRAAAMVSDRDWKERLFNSEFEDGGWQVILIGILYQLSMNSRFKERCNEILAELAPMEMEPNQQTALVQYAALDIKLRISALQMLTILTIRTDQIKLFLEACMEDMTDVRKKKIELQRARKAAAEEFAAKDQERKILLPEYMPESPKLEESTHSIEPDVTEDTIELNGGGSTDGDEGAAAGRSLRRGNDRKRKRDEENARREKIKAEKAEAAKKETKAAKEFKKLVDEVEQLRRKVLHLEEQIDECDSDLREANVQRTKVLGKDRYCNRYYWFERNGQPFGGLPNSSTSSYGYANGRIWVQGPDDMEREGFIDRSKPEHSEYHSRFRCTVPERRQQEEGATILANATEWGFYDTPDHLDALIGWLDDRGEREKALRKELMAWRDKIVQYMTAYHDFVASEERKKVEEEENKEVALASRINTRHKVAEEKAEDVERCCRWTNTMALNELGHIHSRPSKGRDKKGKKGVAVPVSRSGKPATRQGERYKF